MSYPTIRHTDIRIERKDIYLFKMVCVYISLWERGRETTVECLDCVGAQRGSCKCAVIVYFICAKRTDAFHRSLSQDVTPAQVQTRRLCLWHK